MTDTTAVDFQPSENKSGSLFSKKDLDTNMVKLMLEEPFYAAILRGVNKIMTNSIPTAGVSTTGTDINMYWNPSFLADLTPAQVKGLLKHEAMHLAYDHTTTRRMTPHIIHNYATDLAINSDIPAEELPEGGLVPGQEFKELTDEQKSKMSDDAVARYYRISDKIASFPTHQSSEWYFAEIMEDEELKKDITEANDSGEFSMMDSHEEWGEMSDEEKQLVKAKIKKAVKDAIKESDASGRWGSVGRETREHLRKLVSNEVNWRAVLKKFCGLSRRGTRTTSWTRLNRRYAGVSPGVKRGYTSSIAVYIDQSGSVNTEALELIFAELESLSSRTEFVTYHFDTSVDESSETEWRKGKSVSAHRTRCGGTDFDCVTKHANENSNRFDGYLIITDGEAPMPAPSKLKRGWVIVPNRKLIFTPSKRDFVISMKDK